MWPVDGARSVGIAAGQSAPIRRDLFANTSKILCASNRAVNGVRQSKSLIILLAANPAGDAISFVSSPDTWVTERTLRHV
jgi:hypothetical protein